MGYRCLRNKSPYAIDRAKPFPPALPHFNVVVAVGRLRFAKNGLLFRKRWRSQGQAVNIEMRGARGGSFALSMADGLLFRKHRNQTFLFQWKLSMRMLASSVEFVFSSVSSQVVLVLLVLVLVLLLALVARAG